MAGDTSTSGGLANSAVDYLRQAGDQSTPYVDESRQQAGALGQALKGAAPLWAAGLTGGAALGGGGGGIPSAPNTGGVDLSAIGGGITPDTGGGDGGGIFSKIGKFLGLTNQSGGGLDLKKLLGLGSAGLGIAGQLGQQSNINKILDEGKTAFDTAQRAYAEKAPLRNAAFSAMGSMVGPPNDIFNKYFQQHSGQDGGRPPMPPTMGPTPNLGGPSSLYGGSQADPINPTKSLITGTPPNTLSPWMKMGQMNPALADTKGGAGQGVLY